MASLSKEDKLLAAIRQLSGRSLAESHAPFAARRARVRAFILNTGCARRVINPEDRHSPTYEDAFSQAYGEAL